MVHRANKKCLKCSILDVEEAQRLHGSEGDGCWDDLKCHKRRAHYRHRSDCNFKRFSRVGTGLLAGDKPIESIADADFRLLAANQLEPLQNRLFRRSSPF